jgi:hypothetical protein
MPIPTETDVMNAVAGLPNSPQLADVLRAGGNPNSKMGGQTALGRAVVLAYVDKVRLLLRHGANPNRSEDPDVSNQG